MNSHGELINKLLVMSMSRQRGEPKMFHTVMHSEQQAARFLRSKTGW